MSSWRLVSWFTPEYKELALIMAATARRVGVGDIVLYERESTGSWERNVTHKADVLLEALRDTDRDIVYVDADATFHAYPAMFDNLRALGYDFAAHWRDNTELLGGTLWIENCDYMREVWLAAIYARQKSTGEWAQKIMQQAWQDVHGYQLPPEYCCIADTMRLRYPGIRPVIEHHQASRRARAQGLGNIGRDEALDIMHAEIGDE